MSKRLAMLCLHYGYLTYRNTLKQTCFVLYLDHLLWKSDFNTNAKQYLAQDKERTFPLYLFWIYLRVGNDMNNVNSRNYVLNIAGCFNNENMPTQDN